MCNLPCHYGNHDALPCMALQYHTFKCNHTCLCKCRELTSGLAKCTQRCDVTLPCNHRCGLPCGHEGDHECTHTCDEKLENCDHLCGLKCGHEGKHKCTHTDTYLCSICGKKSIIKCKEEMKCKYHCSFVFPCGHRCTFNCCDSSPEHQHLVCSICKDIKVNYIVQFPNRCEKKCPKCDAKCMCLAGEKCYFNCQHNKINEKTPKNEDTLLYCFPCGHIEELEKAKRRIHEETEHMVKQDLPQYSPIHYPLCPCRCKEPITQSNVFAYEIRKITILLQNHWLKANIKLSKLTSEKRRHKWYCVPCSCDSKYLLDINELPLINQNQINQHKQKIFKCPRCKKVHIFSNY